MPESRVYWDSNILISWFKGEKEESERIRKIKLIADQWEDGSLELVFSTIIYIEVLPREMSMKAMNEFEQFMRNKKIIKTHPVNTKVALRAKKLRDLHEGLKTPDAIHVATAVVGRVDVMHTFDNKLLKLSGKPEVDNLLITKCSMP